MDSYILFDGKYAEGAAAVLASSRYRPTSVVLGRASDLGMLGDRSFTLNATIMVRQWNTDQQGDNAIVAINDYGPGTFHWVIRHRRMGASFYGSHGVGYNTELELNRWYHVAVIYQVDGVHCRHSLFVDGVIVASNTFPNLPLQTDSTQLLGQYAGGRPLCGFATNVCLWNVALDARDLSELGSRFLALCNRSWDQDDRDNNNNNDDDDNRLVFSWHHIAQHLLMRYPQVYVYFGPWCKAIHRHCSIEIKERVMTLFLLNLRTGPRKRLPTDVLFHILNYLPVR